MNSNENEINSLPLPDSGSKDLHDSPHDKEQMKTEEFTLDLPDVEDIPGQENIVPPKMNAFVDITIASDDEEGISVFGKETDEEDI